MHVACLKIIRIWRKILAALESEARQSVSVVCDAYLYKSQSMDEYISHPNLKDIHLVRCCILWIPVRGA